MVRRELAAAAFLRLSMRAKLHSKLDAVTTKRERMIQRIEKDEIRAYDNDIRYSKLEELKKKVLEIRFKEE